MILTKIKSMTAHKIESMKSVFGGSDLDDKETDVIFRMLKESGLLESPAFKSVIEKMQESNDEVTNCLENTGKMPNMLEILDFIQKEVDIDSLGVSETEIVQNKDLLTILQDLLFEKMLG